MIRKNEHGDTAFRADIKCEEAVLKSLREMNISIRVISEEHGDISIGKNPLYLGALDGIDGSSVYKKARGVGRYATMFAIFDGTDPKYNDYLVCGIMEHTTKHLLVAIKDQGVCMVADDGKGKPLYTSGKEKLIPKDTKIYIDTYFPQNRNFFESKLTEFNPVCTGCSAVHYTDVANGSWDIALECTRKKNLEIAVAFGLIKEAGGVMTDADGNLLDNQKYFQFGQDTQIPVITAATKQLAYALIEHLKNY